MTVPAAGSERGQASVELIAIVPALVALAILAAQLAVAGWSLWSAADAARAGARAAAAGGDAAAAARSALPSPLRNGAAVSNGRGVEVRVPIPSLIPGIGGPAASARSSLPDGHDG
jgi:hypothetical protein